MEHVKKMYNETLSRMKDLYRDAKKYSDSDIDVYAGKAEAMEQAMDLMKHMLGPAIEAMFLTKNRPIMTFKNFMDSYCDWNKYVTVNYDGKKPVAVGETLWVMENRQDLFEEIVDTFDFHDDTISVRLKPTDTMVENLFKEFQDCWFVETKDSGDVLVEPWHIWDESSTKKEILEWFDKYHSRGLEWLRDNFKN